MKIYLVNNGSSHAVDALITARIREGLDSALTLSFTLTEEDVPYIHDNTVVQYGVYDFHVTSYQMDMVGQSPTCAVECEHISYVLNDETYKLEEFVYSGTAAGALSAVLSGTPLSAGTVEPVGTVNIRLVGGTRRAILISVAAILGGEIEYSGSKVHLRNHRGSVAYVELLGTDNVTDVSYNRDVLAATTAYNIVLGRKTTLSCGDNVHIKFTPLGLDVQTRITAIEYNPYNPFEVEIEVGDYVPDILDTLQDAENKADNALKTARDTKDALSDYAKKSDVSASVDTYINSDEGKASIVASLSGTYVTSDDLTGYVEKTELSAEVGAYIDTAAGTAKIVGNLTGTFVKEDALGNYVQKTELSAEIGAYIDTAAGTAKIVNNLSGTYQKKSDMGSYVTTTTLNTSVAQYIDSTAGKAKIISACSGTYVTGSDLAGYAKASALTSIEQSVSDVEAAITLSSSYSKSTIGTNVYALLQLVSNANSSSIKIKADKIDFTGFTTFVKASDLGASGTTSIDGGRITTGKISADRIEAISVHADAIYGTGTYSDSKLLTTSGLYLYVGGTTANAAATYTYIMAQNQIIIGTSTAGMIKLYITDKSFAPVSAGGAKLGSSTYPWGATYIGAGSDTSYYWKLENACLTPSATTSTATSTYFNIGTSTYPVTAIYTKKLYLNGTELTGGGSGGNPTRLYYSSSNTTYYVEATSGYALVPSHCTSYTHWNLGSSSYYWYDCYLGYGSTRIGYNTSSKLGFFGTTPVTRQTVASSATVATLITALKAYGLIG